MVIEDVVAYPVWVGRRNQLLVKVTTDCGLYGWGEAGLPSREKAVMGAIEHYRGLIVGRDPMEVGRLWQLLYRSQYFEGGHVLSAAISAIDIALHDIRGKALGVPVWQLLGGKQREMVEAFGSCGTDSDEETIEQAAMLAKSGFRCVRLQLAWRDGAGRLEGETPGTYEARTAIARDAELVCAVRERLPSDVSLGVDYHHRLSVAEAASFCQRLPAGTLDFLEEPIRDECPSAYGALRRMTPIPFAIGEEFGSKWQALPYIEQDLMQFLRIDICLVGGFTEAMKVSAWAEAHYIDVMPHNPLGPICLAASIHLAAALPNFSWVEYLHSPVLPEPALDEELFPQRPKIDGTRFPLPTEPGLGVEVNEDVAKRKAFAFFEMPKLRRSDGSLTNW